MRIFTVASLCLAAALNTFPARPAQADPLQHLKQYIETDTTNPPGNEMRGVAFFGAIFDAAGIAYETVEPQPGRGSIWARIEGGDEPALILLHHIDVVPASADNWDTDPLKAEIVDGYVVGRGALDIKSLGIAHLEAFLALHRDGAKLNRDVIFMATADEEAGGLVGAGWLVENRPELFEGVGFLLNEGGAAIQSADHTYVQVEAAQKRPYWLRLVAEDKPGHGSSPRVTSATTRLVRALDNIARAPFEPRVTPAVRAMLAALAPYADPEWHDALADIDTAISEPGFLARLQEKKHRWHALLRDTCSLTVLEGSAKINVVPPEARAELDCRILPDTDAAAFLAGIESRIDDDHVRVEEIMLFDPAASDTDTPLFSLIERKSRENYPGAGVLPGVSTGFTDSHFFREIGIVSYGYGPFLLPEADLGTVHGNNERILIENFIKGVGIMESVVREFTGADGPAE